MTRAAARSLIILVLASGLNGARAAGGDSLTVREAVRQVLASHPSVELAADLIRAADARIGTQQSDLYPRAEADLSYERLGPVPSLAVPGLGAFELYPENNYDAHVGVTHRLFDFGKRSAAVDISQSYRRSAEDNVALVKSTLAFQTVQAFYAILFLRQSIRVQDDEIDALNGHLAVSQRKVETGAATDFDVLTTKVRVAGAESRKIALTNEERKLEVHLRQLLGISGDTPLQLSGDFTQEGPPPAVDTLEARAMAQRPEIKLANDAVRSAELQVHAASLGDVPTLNLNASYGVKNGFIPNLDIFRGNWTAGVQVEVPIFNGFRTRSQEEEAAANLEAARSHRRDVERQIRTEVQQASSDLQASLDAIRISGVEVEQATQAVARAHVRYDSGVITNLDLLDAETSLAQARLVQLQSLYTGVISRYALRKAVGDRLE